MYSQSKLIIFIFSTFAVGRGYISGREYEYQYRGYVTTGFPNITPQYAGAASEGIAIFQPKDDNSIVIKGTNSKISTVNAVIYDLEQYDFKYKELPDFAANLFHTPVKAYFKNGQVTHFQAMSNHSTYINAKKAFLSLFNLHLQPIWESETEAVKNNLVEEDNNTHSYTVVEDGVMGECEVSYVVEYDRRYLTEDNNNVLNITKSINYRKCKHIPSAYYSTFYGMECGSEEHEKTHPLHRRSTIHYNIRGNRHNYVIENIDAEQEISFSPYSPDGQTTSIKFRRHFKLINEKEAPSEIYDLNPEDGYTYYTLRNNISRLKFNDDIDMTKSHYLQHLYPLNFEFQEVDEKIEKVMVSLDDPSYKDDEKGFDYPGEFMEIERAVSMMSYDRLYEMYTKYAEIPKEGATARQERERAFFFDLFISLGTNPAILLAKDLMHNGTLPSDIAESFIRDLPYEVKEVTETLLRELHEICEDPYVTSRENLQTVCYLSLSTIIHNRCIARYHPESIHEEGEYACTSDIPEKYYMYISEHLHKSRDEQERIAYLKAAGKLGVRDSLKDLMPYIEGHVNNSVLLRTNALFATLSIGFRYPQMIQDILIPLYHNQSEHYELRISSFIILMVYDLDMDIYESIAKSLITEKDDQVRSYVYSTFQNLANSTYRCDHKKASNSLYALRILDGHHEEFDSHKYDYTYSKNYYSTGYNKQYGYGGSTTFSYLASDSGYIPRAFYLGLSDYFDGKSRDTLSLLFHQYGFDKIIDKLLEPESEKKSILDLLKASSKTNRDTEDENTQFLKDIEEIIHTKKYEPIHAEAAATIMGHTYSLAYFNDTSFEKFFEMGKLPLGMSYSYKGRYQRFGVEADQTYIIPAESGLPVVLSFYQPVYYHHKFDNLSIDTLTETQGNEEILTGLAIDIDGHIILQKNSISTMGHQFPLESSFLTAGTVKSMTVSLPLKISIKADFKTATLRFKWIPVVHRIVHSSFDAFTVIDNYSKLLRITKEETYKSVNRYRVWNEVNEKFFVDTLGIGFTISKDYDSEWNDCGSWFRFLTEKSFREHYYYLYSNPQLEPHHFDIYLDRPVKNLTTAEVDAQFRYSYHRDPEKKNDVYKSQYYVFDFEEDTHVRTHTSLLSSSIKGEIVFKGLKERKVWGEVIYYRDASRHYNKLIVYAQTTPLALDETEDFHLCIGGFLKYPDLDLNATQLVAMDTLNMKRDVNSELKINFGKQCFRDQEITIRGQHQLSEEQKDLDKKREEPHTAEHPNPYAELYQKCLQELSIASDTIPHPDTCIKYFYLITAINNHTFDIFYKNLSPAASNVTYKLQHYLRHLFYKYTDRVEVAENSDDHVPAEVTSSLICPDMDVETMPLYANNHYSYTHVFPPNYTPVHAFVPYQNIAALKSFNQHYCAVLEKNVVTFDTYRYRLPPIDCYQVIAKDCSPNNHFTIAALWSNGILQKIRIFIGNHIIYGYMTDSRTYVVRLDGKAQFYGKDDPVYLYEDERAEPVLFLQERGFSEAVISEKYGVVVYFSSGIITVRVSPYYRSKLCGLCGNYNGQTYDSPVITKDCHNYDDLAYAYSYAVTNSTCKVPDYKHHCHDSGNYNCTELKTEVLYNHKDDIPHICFSIQAVPQCRPGCVSGETAVVTLEFHCIPTDSANANNFLKESESRVLHEMQGESCDYKAQTHVDRECHAEP